MSRAFITYITLLLAAVLMLGAAMYVFRISDFQEVNITVTLALVAMGILVIGIGGIMKERRELAKYRSLSNRSKVRLPVTEIRKEAIAPDADTKMHVIVCTVLDQKGRVLSEFTSVPLKRDPSKALSKQREVDVYVDPCDVKNYYMDLSFL
jgi:hypothetical protein